jgi:hypothetical protein
MHSETWAPIPDLPAGHIGWRFSRDVILAPEETTGIGALIIEDGKPVDNIFVEREYRLLTEPL